MSLLDSLDPIIFDWCHRSWAAVTPAKYKRDFQYLTCSMAVLKNQENNGTEENGLVTPIPGRSETHRYQPCATTWLTGTPSSAAM